MADLKLLIPFEGDYPVSQTFDEHVQYAKDNGLSYAPGVPGSGYYYGGVDYAMPVGTEIRATQDGKVEKASMDSTGYGYHIRLAHLIPGISKSIYGHLSQLIAGVGNPVRIGEVIGLSGSTGFSTGPHLHFETRLNGTPFDPAPFLVGNLDEGSEEPDFPNPYTTLPGGSAKVAAGADELRIRDGSGLGTFIAGEFNVGARIEIESSPEVKNGYVWRKLVGQNLYVAELNLSTFQRYLEAA